jgi:hypothetical protein
MEMSELNFHIALLEYFKKRKKECTGFDADAIQIIIKGLARLIEAEQSFAGRENIKVHLGHTFGPFGFKIK